MAPTSFPSTPPAPLSHQLCRMEIRVCTHCNPFESLSSLKLPACWHECFRPSVSPWGRETLTSPLTLKAAEIRIAEDGDSGHIYALASAAYGRLGHGPAAHVFGPPKALHQLWDMLNPFSPCLEETATDEQACNVFHPPIVLCQRWGLTDLFSRLEEGASTKSMVLAACFNATSKYPAFPHLPNPFSLTGSKGEDHVLVPADHTVCSATNSHGISSSTSASPRAPTFLFQ